MWERSADNAERICLLIAQGYTLRQIAKQLEFSHAARITDWVRDDAEFAAQYARAKEVQADHMADEILEISDEATNDWMDREGIRVPDHEHLQRSRLRVDTRKWLMSKMLPKKYGDKLDVAHGGSLTVNLTKYGDE